MSTELTFEPYKKNEKVIEVVVNGHTLGYIERDVQATSIDFTFTPYDYAFHVDTMRKIIAKMELMKLEATPL